MSRSFSHRSVLTAIAFCGLVALPVRGQLVEVKPIDGGATVTVDGDPFASYLLNSGHQPVIWPIIGPEGQAMTRQYPLGERLPGEKDDHPHHRSLWFNHGSVNGLDFWMEPDEEDDNQIKHREFRKTESTDGVAEDASVAIVLSPYQAPNPLPATPPRRSDTSPPRTGKQCSRAESLSRSRANKPAPRCDRRRW
jgi:hypothetical protein